MSGKSPMQRLMSGLASHQHFIWPLVIVVSLGIAQQFVPWYAIWPPVLAFLAYAVKGFLNKQQQPAKSTEEIHKEQQTAEQIAQELLAEEEAEERNRRKRSDAEKRKNKPASTPSKAVETAPNSASNSKKREKATKAEADDVDIQHLARFAGASVKSPAPVAVVSDAKADAAPPSSASRKRKTATVSEDGWHTR